MSPEQQSSFVDKSSSVSALKMISPLSCGDLLAAPLLRLQGPLHFHP